MSGQTPIERMLDAVDWQALPAPEDAGDLHATHVGELEIGSARLRCYVLSNGQRVFDADSVAAAFGGAQ